MSRHIWCIFNFQIGANFKPDITKFNICHIYIYIYIFIFVNFKRILKSKGEIVHWFWNHVLIIEKCKSFRQKGWHQQIWGYLTVIRSCLIFRKSYLLMVIVLPKIRGFSARSGKSFNSFSNRIFTVKNILGLFLVLKTLDLLQNMT